MAMEEDDAFCNKYNMTYTLLQRLLSAEDFQHIKTCEPVVIRIVNEPKSPNSKKLKSPGYKHAIVSSKGIFIINTPAKSESDLLLTINMEEVVGVQLIYDEADFLQGELRKTSQHIQVKCRRSPSSDSTSTHSSASLDSISSGEGITLPALSILPLVDRYNTRNNDMRASSSATESYEICQNIHNQNDQRRRMSLDSSITEKNLKNSRSSLPKTYSKSNRKVKGSRVGRQSQEVSSQSTRRALPKPLDGTETTNASYTKGLTPNKDNLRINSLSPSRSCSDLSAPPSNHQLTISASSHSRSWNDLLKAGADNPKHATEIPGSTKFIPHAVRANSVQLSSSAIPSNLKPHAIRANSVQLSASTIPSNMTRMYSLPTSSLGLEGSVSSKMFKLFKGTQSETESVQSILPSQSLQDVKEISDIDVDIYTVEAKSMLYNLIKESWMQSLLLGMYKMDEKRHMEMSSSSKIDNTAVLQKFTEIKEEILKCEINDQFFLLTKEIIYACRNYVSIKKKTWKSAPLIKYYMKKIKILVESNCQCDSARMDEIDTLILIGEFFICIFQESELFPQRNHILNENQASFVKLFIEYIVMPLKFASHPVKSNQIKNSELEDLIYTWYDTCVGLLYEIIYAANNSSWNCKLKNKSFNVPKVAQHLSDRESNVMNLVDHVVKRMTSYFTENLGHSLSPANVTQLYKELTFLQFIGLHCPQLKKNTREHHREELKYYISSSSVDRIPQHYPLTPVINVLLPDVVQMVAAH